MQISFVMLSFSDQISGGGKSLQGGKLAQGAPPCPAAPLPRGRKPDCGAPQRDVLSDKMVL